VSIRKLAIARVVSPFILSCVGSFQDAYAHTGMNLVQSIVVIVMRIGQRGWRALSRQAEGRSDF
jgi:hypothetical protein